MFGLFLVSIIQNERKIYLFCSVSFAQFVYFFEGSVFTFQFLNDKNIIVNFIIGFPLVFSCFSDNT